MDSKDLAILQQLLSPRTVQWNPRISYAEVARAGGIDEETVRTRIAGWQQQGILQGWDVSPHPSLLDRELFRVEVRGIQPDAKRELFGKLRLLDGARVAFDHFQGGLAVGFFARPGRAQERLVSLIEELSGGAVRAWPMALPPCRHAATELEWRIIRALRAAPRRPYHELADEVGVSSRTIRRRMDRMLEARALLLILDVDLPSLSGVFSAELRVFHGDQGDPEPVHARLANVENRVFGSFGQNVSLIGFLGDNVSPLETLRTELSALDGVEEIQLDILRERIMWDAWLDEAIEERIGKTEAT